MGTRRAWVLVVCLTCAWTSAARATPKEDKAARKLYQKGQTAYGLGHFEEAAGFYVEAFKVSPKPGFLFNAAQAYRLANMPDKALEFYRSFLRMEPSAQIREEVERRIAEAEAQVAPPKPPESPPPDGNRAKVPSPDRVAETAVPMDQPATRDVPEDRASRPIYKKWWFWAGIGAAGVATVAIVVVASGGGDGAPSANYGSEAIF